MVSSKLSNSGTSIFAVMTKMANDYKALNLSQGFPELPCSKELIKLVTKNMNEGFNQYAQMEGYIGLREKISEKTEKLYSRIYDPEKEITITAGATQAIYTAISAFVKEGDEVIVIEPAFDTYVPSIEMSGGTAVYVELKEPLFRIDWNEVNNSITSRTKMIIINTPHNPTGAIFSSFDMEKLQKIVAGSNIIILSDEVYEHILFDNFEHQSVARFPKLAERSLIISSFGKTYNATGFKIGYCMAPEKLTREFRLEHQNIVFAVNHPIQRAYAEFLKYEDEYLKLGAFYQKKRDFFNDLLKNSKFKIKPSHGTFYQVVDYSDISDEKDTVFAERLVKEIGVASIPVSVFYHKTNDSKNLRFCFAKSDETLEKAAEKLLKL